MAVPPGESDEILLIKDEKAANAAGARALGFGTWRGVSSGSAAAASTGS